MKRSLLSLILFFPLSLTAGWNPFTPAPRTGAAAFDQRTVSVASNGFEFLAAWTTVSPDGHSGVYVARVNADGTLQATVGTPLDPTASQARGISITAARDGYFASWISERGLNAAIVDSFGRIVKRVTLNNVTAAGTLTAWNGAVHLVVAGATATLFDDNDDVVASNIAAVDSTDFTPKLGLTADTNGFLLVATKQHDQREDIYGRRISPSGAASDWTLIRSVNTQINGLAIRDNLLAWGDPFGVWIADINSPTMTRQLVPDNAIVGDVLTSGGKTWITYDTAYTQTSRVISLNSDGSFSVLTIADSRAVIPAHLAASNTRLFSTRVISQNGQDIEGRFITPSMTDAPFIVARSETNQEHGEIAADPNGMIAAVWDEKTGDTRTIYLTRFNAAHQPIDAAGIAISTSGDNSYPAISFNGTNFLVAWTRTIDSDTRTVARRITPDGHLLDAGDIVVGDSSDYEGPRLATDGTNWLVLRERVTPFNGCNRFYGTRLFASRVSATGTLLDGDGLALPTDNGANQIDADVTWSGTQFVAAWTNVCADYRGPSVTSISASVIAPDLTHVDFTTFDRVSSAQGASYGNPRVAATGDRRIIAWQSNVNHTLKIEYRVLQTSAARRRAVGAPTQTSIDGTLLDASVVNGQFSLLTSIPTPWAPDYPGIFRTQLDANGRVLSTEFRFVLNASEQPIGKAVIQDGTTAIAEVVFPDIFDPLAAAYRLYLRDF